jgi:hypothetical protein
MTILAAAKQLLPFYFISLKERTDDGRRVMSVMYVM